MFKKLPYFAILAIQLFFFQASAQTIYVNAAQATNGDGVTWATAFNNLQSAIEAATPINEVWVAQGDYYPSKDKLGMATPTDGRAKTFYINKNIKLFGGFLGTETALAQRDINNNTTLSGDIGAPSDTADNAYHVVYIDGTSPNGNIDNTCIINGFTINGGNANGTFAIDKYGAGIICWAYGAGKLCNPTLINNTLEDNVAFYQGGGIANIGFYGIASPKINYNFFIGNKAGGGGAILNWSVDNGVSSPIINNCFFISNIGGNENDTNSSSVGGAICNFGSGGESSPIITNSTFVTNSSIFGGGAISNISFGQNTFIGNSSPKIANCVFSQNISKYGGAIDNSVGGGISQSVVSNCTFSQNISTTQGQAIFTYQSSAANSLVEIKANNCIFSDNPGAKLEVYNLSPATTTLINCIYSDGTLNGTISPQTGNTFINCIEADPKFINPNSLLGADNQYPSADDGLSIQLGSPAINAGDNSLFPAGLATNSSLKSAKVMAPGALTTDITNTVTRILETTIDIGAYETSFATPLPLNLLEFTVGYQNEEAKLNWKTSNEANTNRFEIERSIDGKNFKKIGVENAKNSTEIQNYVFTDASIYSMDNQHIYYRLKQFDNDGSHKFSKIIALALKDRNVITISPNPVNTFANINIGKENDLINTKMILFDVQGKQINNYIIGNTIESLDLSNLPKGMYFMKFKNDKTVKFLKN